MLDRTKKSSEGYLIPLTEGELGVNEKSLFSNYQLKAYEFAVSKCAQRRKAIDIGANYGIMTIRMIEDFSTVESFEPLFYELLLHNINNNEKVNVYPYALGETENEIIMELYQNNGGRSRVVSDTPGKPHRYKKIEMKTLDSYNFKDIDFIKMDVEDYEWDVMKGAFETIEKCNVFMIEIKRNASNKKLIENYFLNKNFNVEKFDDDYVFWRN